VPVCRQDATAYLRKELAAAEEVVRASGKATRAAQDAARAGFDGNVPVLTCWQDLLAAVDTHNQKQAEVLATAQTDVRDLTKELEQTRKAVRSTRSVGGWATLSAQAC
jgi:outer membrane protein TolC